MRMPNRAIKRERYPSPTVDDLIHALNGAKVFSKFDLRSGYHQLVLSEESRSITTFVTHKGIMRYKRLNFEQPPLARFPNMPFQSKLLT